KPDLYRLAGWRAGFRHTHFHVRPGNAGHGLAQVVEDQVCRLALAPVHELVLDHTDDVLVYVLSAAPRLADPRINRFHPGPAEQPFLCLPGSSIHFGQRKIAPRMYVEQPIVRLDIGEKLNPRTPFAVGHDDADEQRNRQEAHGDGKAYRPLDYGHVEPVALLLLGMHFRPGELRA